MPALMYGGASAANDGGGANGNVTTDDAFVSFYFGALGGDPPEGTLRLFDKQDNYAAYGSCARFLAAHFFRTNTVVRTLIASSRNTKQEPLSFVTLSHAACTSFLRDALTSRRLRVEIYSRCGGNDNGAVVQGSERWRVSRKASPGNLGDVEDVLFSNESGLLECPVLAALSLASDKSPGSAPGTKAVGLAFADTSRRELGVCDYTDDDLFSATESLLIQLGVKELLVATDDKAQDYELAKLRPLIERCNIVITDRKKKDFKGADVEQDLNRLLVAGDGAAQTRADLSESKNALGSLSALVAYLGLMADDVNFGAWHARAHAPGHFVRLDGAAVRALNLMPDSGAMGGASKTMSLFGLLNRCKTSQGTRLLATWLKQPLVNKHEINNRLELVHALVDALDLRDALQNDHLKLMPDLHRIAKRLQRRVSGLEDVVTVYQALMRIPLIVQACENATATDDMMSDERRALIDDWCVARLRASDARTRGYVDMVETTIDLAELDRHNYVIKPEFDDALGALRDELARVTDGLDDVHRDVARELGMSTDGKTLHFEQHSLYGHCFRLTRKEAGALKKAGAGRFVELGAKSNGVFFTTKRLRELNDEHRDLTTKYDRKQAGLVKEVVAIAASYCPVLEEINNVVAHVDVVCSLAASSALAPTPYVKPTICSADERAFVCRNARHPCLEVQDGVDFIANDIEMRRDDGEFEIITGPNMGGKSTYIRQAGVIALMAQIGCFVPCDEAVVPIFDAILCRVGAGDSTVKGVSTFMAEMLETAAIMRTATRDSLIIIDELGRGTSTSDGFGLAWAISEHLCARTRAFTLFASHFHELTALATEHARLVRNLHVVAHVDTRADSLTGSEITLLYKVEPGICDRSFGIHVAELAKFPDAVVKLARRKADELEDFNNNNHNDGGPDDDSVLPALSAEETARGTALAEELLREWAGRARAEKGARPAAAGRGGGGGGGGADDGDVAMANDGAAEQEQDEGVTLERELELLRDTVDKYKDRLGADKWVQSALMNAYA